jgi:hypothetical protein
MFSSEATAFSVGPPAIAIEALSELRDLLSSLQKSSPNTLKMGREVAMNKPSKKPNKRLCKGVSHNKWPVKFPLSGVVYSAANGIAGFISRIPIGITVLPTRVRAEASGRRYTDGPPPPTNQKRTGKRSVHAGPPEWNWLGKL